MEYNFKDIEKKWQARWAAEKTFAAKNASAKPKYYVLDMFPYPSGAGLHVGHPLGYIASDIVARYKRHQGFNVLHPMGYDSFGLPAEQYAIQTGQHPQKTTEENIARYREQLDKIGFSFDWDREVRTSDPQYYKWTQWIFLQLFNAWYNKKTNKAEKIETLIKEFETGGNAHVHAACEETKLFTAADWKAYSEQEKSDLLMNYRIAYLGEAYVNWCPALGTVLANDEVKDGVSERGGYPVERKLMKQWSMRITAYAQRLLDGLDKIDWPEPLKEAQRNWIGRSEGISIVFGIENTEFTIEVFTTRPDTIFGVSFVTLAPENELVGMITTPEYLKQVEEYVNFAKNRSERERQADVRKVSGQFTGAYVIHPFTQGRIPVYVGDYVLAGYGTGAVMAVPGHDERDHRFAKHFGLPILKVVHGPDVEEQSNDAKEGKCMNSDFLNGLEVKDAIRKAIGEIEKRGLGKGKVNFRLRDAVFGRQRYWGEPIPIYYKDGVPHALPENELPLVLPQVDKYLPTEDGEPPLARAKDWKYKNKYDYELTTMPGWAGSSWYYLRYEDAHNDKEFAGKEAIDYWRNVDLYLGGSEHATGHLLYVRFWTMFLKDFGYLDFDEPAKKLINQGMIQGDSRYINRFVFELKEGKTYYRDKPYVWFVSADLIRKYNEGNTSITNNQFLNIVINKSSVFKKEKLQADDFKEFKLQLIPVDVNIVDGVNLNIELFRNWREEYKNAEFISESDSFQCENLVEKMSKSKWNVVSPDKICNDFGADTLRLYEMFLGPLELSKPWNTNGITGVHGFLKKLWRLFHQPEGISEAEPTKAELKALHKSIKKITEDIERFSFNTSVSNFMICVNELTDLKCSKRAILEPLLIILSPYAPHITEELWEKLGHTESIAYAPFPVHNESYLVESNFSYPVSFNGKMRFNIELPLALSVQEIEKIVLEAEQTHKYLDGKTPKKVIIVPKKIVNIVV